MSGFNVWALGPDDVNDQIACAGTDVFFSAGQCITCLSSLGCTDAAGPQTSTCTTDSCLTGDILWSSELVSGGLASGDTPNAITGF